MSITPMILGRGRAGEAVAKALASLSVMRPELGLLGPVWLERGAPFDFRGRENPVVCIANPHGLHADAILAAERAGAVAILCEKPACVSLEQVARLREVRVPTAVMHVYRQTWGVATLREMVIAGEFGELIAIEGRYWQASTAERALTPGPVAPMWKDDTRLSGEYDTYLDVGTHWIDAASYLIGAAPARIRGWRSYANSTLPHRESHVQVRLEYPSRTRALASISKTVHGSPNHFELNLIGTRRSATWTFLNPDEILIGEGRDRRVLSRKTTAVGSKQPPYHGMGWLEGYIEIASRLLDDVASGGRGEREYPRLRENLGVVQAMLKTEWDPA